MLQSKPVATPTVAYNAGRTIRLAPLACPSCGHRLRAQDVEPLGDDEVRIVCSACPSDLLTIER
jgi:hypothetical protein